MQAAGRAQDEANRLTILDMLDRLETSIAAIGAARNGGGQSLPVPYDMDLARAPEPLLLEIQKAGLSKTDFCDIFGLHVNVLQAWLTGHKIPPPWVPVCARILALLAPPARQGLLKSAEPRKGKNTARSHPFSRIEEL